MIDNRTAVMRIARPVDADDVRRVVVANALSIVDVEAGDPRTRATLEALLGPVAGRWPLDVPFAVTRDARGRPITRGVSTCGLVAEGLWRRAGVAAAWLTADYVPGTAITRAVRWASRLSPRSAYHTPAGGQRPRPGDYVVIGTALATHALTVVAWEDDVVVSVDGGQVGRAGLQAVHRCRRPWRAAGTSASLGGRVVQGWIAVELLPGLAECDAPVGWSDVDV